MKIDDAIRQRQFEDDYQRALINLIYTSNWLRDEQIRRLKPFGLLPQHYNLLRIIKGRHPEPVSPGEMKEVMLDKANDLTRLLDKLEKKGLISRKLCETNRRKMDVHITAEGLRLLEQAGAVFHELQAEIMQQLSDLEAAKLSRLLDKMRG